MSALEFSLFISVFGIPLLGAIYLSASARGAVLINRFGFPLLASAATLPFILALITLIMRPELESIFDFSIAPMAMSHFDVALALNGERLYWLLAFTLAFFCLVITYSVENIGKGWAASHFYYLVSVFVVGVSVLLFNSPFVAVLVAEILWTLLYFLDGAFEPDLSAYFNRGVYRRGIFLLSIFGGLALLQVVYPLEAKVLASLSIFFYSLSWLYSTIVLKSWQQLCSFLLRIFIGLYLVTRIGIILGNDPLMEYIAYTFVGIGFIHGFLTLMTTVYRSAVAHTVLSGVGCFLGSLLMVQGERQNDLFALGSFVLLLCFAVLASLHRVTRPRSQARSALYACCVVVVAVPLSGLLNVLKLLLRPEFPEAARPFLIAYIVGLTAFALAFGRSLQIARKEVRPARKSWQWREDASELCLWLLLIGAIVATVFWAQDLNMESADWNNVSLWLGAGVTSFIVAAILGYVLAGKNISFAQKFHQRAIEEADPRSRKLILFALEWLGGALERSRQRSLGFTDRQTTAWASFLWGAEDRFWAQILWNECRSYFHSSSMILRYAHNGLVRSFWFWGLLVWILAGVLIALR